MKLVKLGTDVFTGEEVFFKERLKWGTCGIFAVPRYGKSVLVKNLLCEVAKYRKIIIFDYMGEHKLLRFPNFIADNPNSIPDLHVINMKDYGYYVGDFRTPPDWQSLTAPARASQILSEIAKDTESHFNQPEIFLELIKNLATNNKELENEDNRFDFTINSASKQSMETVVYNLLKGNFFLQPNDNREKLNIIKQLKKHKHILINLGLREGQEDLARAYVGMLLRDLSPYLELYHPCLFFEEADKIFPAIQKTAESIIPSSLAWGWEYLNKLQKCGVEMFYISQSPSMMEYSFSGCLTKIIGRLPGDQGYGNMGEISKRLIWDNENNIRQFAFIEIGNPRIRIFQPDNVKTMEPGLLLDN